MVTEGIMTLMDIIGRGMVHHMNSSVYLVSGYAYMINHGSPSKLVEQLFSVASAMLFPIALGTGL